MHRDDGDHAVRKACGGSPDCDDGDDHAVRIACGGSSDVNMEGCDGRRDGRTLPRGLPPSRIQPALSFECADGKDMAMTARKRKPMNAPPSGSAEAGPVGARRGHRPGSVLDEEATLTAFLQVVAECPPHLRARLTAVELDPRELTIFRSEIVALHQSLAPFAPFEWSIVADIGLCTAEAARAQRIVTALIQEQKRSVLTNLLKNILKGRSATDIDAIVEDYCAGGPKAVDLVDAALARAGLGPSVVTALSRKSHEVSILDLERTIDRMGNRRLRMLRELKADRPSRGGTASARPPSPNGGHRGR
jgi:hypothetical protein